MKAVRPLFSEGLRFNEFVMPDPRSRPGEGVERVVLGGGAGSARVAAG